MKTVLVTGGAGFIGSHFVRNMANRHPDWQLVTADALTYAGDVRRLAELADNPRHVFVHADVTDPDAMAALFAQYRIDTVVHFAAQTHVDSSIKDPEIFTRTNVLGTQCLLQAARQAWQTGSGFAPGVRFLQVSTDEVYGEILEGAAAETAPLRPASPYAASKAAADLLVLAYVKTYGFPALITRSTNNYGTGQYPEKLIPLMVGCALRGEPLPVYGDGLQKRDWLHVNDHCAALDTVLHRDDIGEVYNIGAGCEQTNLLLVQSILGILGKSHSLIRHVADRPGHDRRYSVSTAKIEALGWQPAADFQRALEATVRWYASQ